MIRKLNKKFSGMPATIGVQDKYDLLVEANVALGNLIDSLCQYQDDVDGFDEEVYKDIDSSLITLEGSINNEFNKLERLL